MSMCMSKGIKCTMCVCEMFIRHENLLCFLVNMLIVFPSVTSGLNQTCIFNFLITTYPLTSHTYTCTHTDIKKAISCLLFGGSRKRLPDGLTRRGDINLLLLGDPGTAKSQLLKFVEKVAPIGVYTSGKGSSAAGLTASVMRDPASVSDGRAVCMCVCVCVWYKYRCVFGRTKMPFLTCMFLVCNKFIIHREILSWKVELWYWQMVEWCVLMNLTRYISV